MLECNNIVTIIHHNKLSDDDEYICTTYDKASWFKKNTITTSADGAKPVNTYDVRVFGDFEGVTPSLGDYVVKGIKNRVETPADLKNEVYFRITAIGFNKRAVLPHWRLSGQ
jgi:hypothetical protein